MGWCLIGGGWAAGYTEAECNDAGGVYSETGPNPDNGDDQSPYRCFIRTILTRSFAQAILDLGGTYESAVAFRDGVLGSSAIGKKMIKTYYKYNPTMQAIALRNYDLLADSMKTWQMILPFVRATVAAAEGKPPGGGAAPRFTKGLHARVAKLIDRLGADSQDERFHAALAEVKAELARYAGLTPEGAMEALRRPSRGHKKG